jgi:hypothetical protein
VRREGGKENRKGKNQKKRMKGKCKKKTQKKNAQRTIKGILGDKEEQKKQQEQNELPILEIQMSKGKGCMTNKTYETMMKTMQLIQNIITIRFNAFCHFCTESRFDAKSRIPHISTNFTTLPGFS